MLVDLNAFGSEKVKCDLCIVGAGPAGITLATALDGSKLKVLLLESGSVDFDLATQDLYKGEIVDQIPSIPLENSRLRFLGGASNHWGGSLGPLDEQDFEERAWVPMSGWPFGRAELEPYYHEAHRLMGVGPMAYDSSQWPRSLGLVDLSGSGVEHRARNRRKRGACRFGPEFRERLERSQNVTLTCNANLTALERSPDGRSIRSLTVVSLAGKQITVEPRRTVLACGGVENARILLHNEIDRELDFVGRCFMYHPRPETGTVILANQAWPLGRDPYSEWCPIDPQLIRFTMNLAEKVQRDEGLANHTFKLNALPPTGLRSATAQLFGRLRSQPDMAAFLDELYTVVGELLESDDEAPATTPEETGTSYKLVAYPDEWPKPENRVRLGAERDALGTRRPVLEWTTREEERVGLRRSHEILAREFGKLGIGRVQLKDDLDQKDVLHELVRAGGGGGHQMGLTRISQTPATGVVDANLKLHGIDDLYCAGSSVFPTGSWVNPTLTIAALSLRLAEHLKSQA